MERVRESGGKGIKKEQGHGRKDFKKNEQSDENKFQKAILEKRY